MVWFIASLAGLQKVIVQLSHVGCHFSIPPSKMNAAKWQSEHGQLGFNCQRTPYVLEQTVGLHVKQASHRTTW